MTNWQRYGRIDGAVLIVGFGSIGRGALPLILRHFEVQPSQVVVLDPDDTHRSTAEGQGCRFVKAAITRDNYRELLTPLLKSEGGQSFMVNLSVDVSSMAMIEFCQDLGVLYVDTVAEPWAGTYTDPTLTLSQRSNYALREQMLELRRRRPGGSTAINCCGANPGMVSWFVKQALMEIAGDLGMNPAEPQSRAEWAALMQAVGVQGIHVAERDTQRAREPKPMGVFVNTWSVEGFVSEGLQPAELGWGTHEKALPPEGRRHDFGNGAAIYLERPGAGTRVRSWTPTARAQHGWLITHNEAISIADYFTVRDGEEVVYRPTCHYAYHPNDDAVLSLDEMAGRQWEPQSRFHILDESEIVDGADELGVLLYGHARNAYWFGSQLTIEQTRKLAPDQNATALQVTSAVLAGMVWALENPNEGLKEVDEIDYRRCLDVQRQYLGPVVGVYTDWTPVEGRGQLFPEDLDRESPWQFSNVIVR
ncbi:homospermidine synthase [Faunimonas pinastri]|uniref:Homospermidine synthase n=1 Tax=Faunimonas pinastri TaxID=1855383 RepID=A0A1H9LXB0_9HYPH|nr:saccharopine dehydrogenase C-terminal domain-containing protein [Faunimonas pinastri]SER16061.1 homospermidine synthase [Faunimonas pinastri]